MDQEEMKRIDNEVKDAIGVGDFEAFDRLMAPELAAGFKGAIAALRQSFPDYAGTNEQQIAEGDTVATRWVYYGTHRGDYCGVAPTGKRITFTGISMSRFADGKMVDTSVESDELAVLRQIGATAVPTEE
jgi:predicted ester cyclase